MKVKSESIKRLLVYRPGSIGDTIVSLPSLYFLKEEFPDAELRLLSNRLASTNTVSPEALLKGTDIISAYYYYKPGKANAISSISSLHAIRNWRPQICAYLGPPRDVLSLLCLHAFLRLSGAPVVGIPYDKNMRTYATDSDGMQLESEAQRLYRSLSGTAADDIFNQQLWDLKLQEKELESLTAKIKTLESPYFCICTGAKQTHNIWAEAKWMKLIELLSREFSSQLGLLFIGGSQDFEFSERLSKLWQGTCLNLAGRSTVRQSALLLKRSLFFLGNDSGAMHLSGAVGTPILALFANTLKRGIWHPPGEYNIFIYPESSAFGIESISAELVFQRATELIRKLRA